ncbi:hypothetical protein ACCUM_0553 [Candidatus Accumulibacter phosphatis]|nr:hypothetical protein ACCUM_0553 [Candidatus Accumulibacter phosphatis]
MNRQARMNNTTTFAHGGEARKLRESSFANNIRPSEAIGSARIDPSEHLRMGNQSWTTHCFPARGMSAGSGGINGTTKHFCGHFTDR